MAEWAEDWLLLRRRDEELSLRLVVLALDLWSDERLLLRKRGIEKGVLI
jgi:hypothetical protein